MVAPRCGSSGGKATFEGVGFQEKVGAGTSAGHVRPHFALVPQATHQHHSQHPRPWLRPASANSYEYLQRQQMRSRWGSRRNCSPETQDCLRHRRSHRQRDAVPGRAADGHVRCSWGEERYQVIRRVVDQELLGEGGSQTSHAPCERG